MTRPWRGAMKLKGVAGYTCKPPACKHSLLSSPLMPLLPDMKSHNHRRLLLACALLMSVACQEHEGDGESARLGSKTGSGSMPAGFRPMRTGKSKNYKESPRREPKVRTGEDLTKLEGEAGDFFRNRVKEAEVRRKTQRWLQPADLDLGERRAGVVAKGSFKLENPTDKAVMIKGFISSCLCQQLILHLNGKEYELKKSGFEPIELPAGAKGVLEVHIEAREGQRTTSVTMLTTDEKDGNIFADGNILVYARVKGVKDFLLTVDGRIQTSVYLGTLTRNSTKSFELTARARDKKAFKIVAHRDLPPKMKIHFEVDPDDPSVWHIRGTLGPDLDPGNHEGGLVILETDRGAGLEFSVTALVLDPIEIEPRGLISLGHVPKKKGVSVELTIRINEPGANFGIERIEARNWLLVPTKLSPKLFGIATRMAEDGRSGTITLTIPPGLERGKLSGNLIISFKQKDLPARVIRFTGIVR